MATQAGVLISESMTDVMKIATAKTGFSIYGSKKVSAELTATIACGHFHRA